MEKKYKTKKEVQDLNPLYFSCYIGIKKGFSPSQIGKKYKLQKQKIQYYMTRLKGIGVIKKMFYGVWEVSRNITEVQLGELIIKKYNTKKKKYKTSSIGTRGKPKSNLHALHIKFPILEGKIKDDDWEIKEVLKNWIPKYTSMDHFGGLRLKNNNNKSLSVFVKSRDVDNVDQVHVLANQLREYMFSFFKNKHGVILDKLNCQVKNLDIATEDKNAESMRGKGERFQIDLNKKAEKIFDKDDREGKAWIDGTPYNFSAESNDLDWKREYLNMPFSIRNLAHSLPILAEYNENIKLHMGVQREQLKTQKQIQKLLSKLNKLH